MKGGNEMSLRDFKSLIALASVQGIELKTNSDLAKFQKNYN